MHVVRTWEVDDAGGIGRVRHEVTDCLSGGSPDPHGHLNLVGSPGDRMAYGGLTELRNRVALACSELVTNALRHGQRPVEVRLLTDGAAWLLDVTDAATDRMPNPGPERPLGHGGYGLLLVARLASQLGWYVSDDAKHVWARIEMVADADLIGRPGDGWVECACGSRHWGRNGAAAWRGERGAGGGMRGTDRGRRARSCPIGRPWRDRCPARHDGRAASRRGRRDRR